MFLILVGIIITNDYSTWFLCFATTVFKPFHFKVNNLRFAPIVFSSLKIRSKLEFFLHNLGNEWKMLHFFRGKRGKNRFWIDFYQIMEKNHRKAEKMQLLSYRSKMDPWQYKFDHWALQWYAKQLSFVWFYMLTTEKFKKSHEKCSKRGKLDKGVHYLWLTL